MTPYSREQNQRRAEREPRRDTPAQTRAALEQVRQEQMQARTGVLFFGLGRLAEESLFFFGLELRGRCVLTLRRRRHPLPHCTVKLALPVIEPRTALTVTLPADRPVATPREPAALLTLAMLGVVESQVT